MVHALFFSFFLDCSIHSYASAIENNTEKRELSALSDDESDVESDTGCSTILTDTATQSKNVPNVFKMDKSTALIDFSLSEAQDGTEMLPTANDTMTQECNVKVQPSDCSVVTLSSEESDVAVKHDTSNPINHENKDDELFERSISCPPSELQDELFENSSSNDEMDSQQKRK